MTYEILSTPEPTPEETLEIAAARLASAEFVFRRLLVFAEQTDAGYIAAGYDSEALAERREALRSAIKLSAELIAEFVGPRRTALH